MPVQPPWSALYLVSCLTLILGSGCIDDPSVAAEDANTADAGHLDADSSGHPDAGPSDAVCGDSFCDVPSEDCDSCPSDCEVCPTPGTSDTWMQAGARDNGLDMDDDFIVGEPEDSLVCDREGGQNVGRAYVEDVDGDGQTEQQYWVVGTGAPGMAPGTDSAFCGALNDPCATVAQAMANASGPGDGEDIFCIAGVLTGESLRVTSSGQAGTKTKTPAPGTNEQWDFEYPSNPTMVIGADLDNDDIYPPNDTDDVAIFQSAQSGSDSYAFRAEPQTAGNRIEVAHITWNDWGRYSKENGGIFNQKPGNYTLSHYYIHDFAANRINYENCHASDTIMFNAFSFRPNYVAFEYGSLQDIHGYIARGGYHGHHVRYRGLRVRHRALGVGPNQNAAGQSCNNTGGRGGNWMRVWATTPGEHFIEWIDNDLEVVGYHYGSGSGSQNQFVAGGIMLCSIRKMHAVGNRIANYGGGLSIDTNDGICENKSPQFGGDYSFSNNFVVITSPADVVPNRFYNGLGWQDIGATPVNPLTDGLSGYYRVWDNEFNLTALGDDNGFAGSFFYMGNGPEADYSGLQVDIRRNLIMADWSRGSGNNATGAFLHQVGSDGDALPDNFHIEDNILFNPFLNGDNQPMVNIKGFSDIANFTGGGNQWSECHWRVDGTSSTTISDWSAASGIDVGTCGNVQLP